MDIEIKSSVFEQNINIANSLTKFLKSCVNSSLGTDSMIDKIIISDQESFGNELYKLQKEYECISGYTNNDMHIAIAQTITDHRNDTTPRSSIVYNDLIFGAILQESSKSDNMADWELDVQLFHYCIFHELAHCRDYYTRKSNFTAPRSSFPNNDFKISTVKGHYIDTLLSEFAACVLSGNYLTKQAFQREVDNTINDCSNMILELLEKKKLYGQQKYSLIDLAYLASQTFWFIMVQFSKLIGSSFAEKRNYSFYKIPSFTTLKIDLSLEIGLLAEHLTDLWKLYPVWDEENTKELFYLWDAMAKKQGFDFVEGSPQDALWIKLNTE